MEDKRIIRQNMLRLLEKIGASERKAAGARICKGLLAMEAFDLASTVFAYAPLAIEPDLEIFLDDMCSRDKLAMPRSLKNGSLVFHRVRSVSDLAAGNFGIPEPLESWPTATVSTGDVILVPGLAFTITGIRLGRGGGYYDRFLSSLCVDHHRVSACYGAQIVKSLPREEHDQGVDYLVTETATIETLNR